MEVRRGVTAGDDFPVFDFDGVGVGLAICMDSAAAETYRLLAQRGAEVVLMPIMGDFRATPWRKGAQTLDVERWKLIQRAHAFDNHLYVVVARNVNVGSAITAPWGEILAYNEGDRDLIWADVDVDERREHPLGTSIQAVLWAMRRPAVYGSLADCLTPAGPSTLRGHPPAGPG
jgi:predicted amidohydrolase